MLQGWTASPPAGWAPAESVMEGDLALRMTILTAAWARCHLMASLQTGPSTDDVVGLHKINFPYYREELLLFKCKFDISFFIFTKLGQME